MTVKEGKGKNAVWVDGEGVSVPVKYIDGEVKARESLIDSVFDRAKKLSAKLEKEKECMGATITAYLTKVAGNYGVNWKGNTAIVNFGKDKKIEVNVANKVAFDERLQIAKSMIDSCVERWAKTSDDKIKVLINKAFKVDKKGRIDVKMILTQVRQYLTISKF